MSPDTAKTSKVGPLKNRQPYWSKHWEYPESVWQNIHFARKIYRILALHLCTECRCKTMLNALRSTIGLRYRGFVICGLLRWKCLPKRALHILRIPLFHNPETNLHLLENPQVRSLTKTKSAPKASNIRRLWSRKKLSSCTTNYLYWDRTRWKYDMNLRRIPLRNMSPPLTSPDLVSVPREHGKS